MADLLIMTFLDLLLDLLAACSVGSLSSTIASITDDPILAVIQF